MINLPHLYILRYLEAKMEFLRNHPEHVHHLLCGFQNPVLMSSVYGAKYIDQCIEWFQNHSFHFVLGYRLDMDKLPSICVMYEGGSETTQFVGDYGEVEKVRIQPAEYAKMDVKDIQDGNLIISKLLNMEDKIWRNLIVSKGKFKASIKSFGRTAEGDLIVYLSNPAELKLGLDGWKVQSFVDSKFRSIGSSMDRVKVKVYLTIQGDPELCEMVSCIVRYLLKQSRLFLANNGLYNSTFGHGPLSRNADFEESTVWSMEFTISGEQQDRWIMTESTPGDKLELEVYSKSDKPGNEDVLVWQSNPSSKTT